MQRGGRKAGGKGSGPRLSAIGRALPDWLKSAVLGHSAGLDLGTIVADLLLDHPKDPSGFDEASTRRWYYLVSQTVCRYFRLRVIGAENIPAGASMIVGCHSGVMPWDAACLVTAIYEKTGRFSRNTGHFLWAANPAVRSFLTARGVVIGEPESLELLLRQGEIVTVFPGGAEDMCRPFLTQRYRVPAHKGFARGRGGYIKIALRTGVPIVPVAIVGAEETHLLLTDIPPLARLLSMPFFPVVLSPLPLPARIYVRFGEPIHLEHPPEAASDQAVVDRLNRNVRREVQSLIDDTCRRRHGVYLSSYDDS